MNRIKLAASSLCISCSLMTPAPPESGGALLGFINGSGERVLYRGWVAGESPAPGAGSTADEGKNPLSAREAARDFEMRSGIYNMYALSSLLIEPEIYHDVAPRLRVSDRELPVIEDIVPYGRRGPSGLVESGTLIAVLGRNLDSATQVVVNGLPNSPLLVAGDCIVALLEGLGPSQLQINTRHGFSTPPRPVLFVKVSPEPAPPLLLRMKQSADIVLRIEGASSPVALTLAIDSDAISFIDGTRIRRVTSAGGTNNIARAGIQAIRAGAYELSYRLDNHQAEVPPR